MRQSAARSWRCPRGFSVGGLVDVSDRSKRSRSCSQFSTKIVSQAPRPSTRSSGRGDRARRPRPRRCRRRASRGTPCSAKTRIAASRMPLALVRREAIERSVNAATRIEVALPPPCNRSRRHARRRLHLLRCPARIAKPRAQAPRGAASSASSHRGGDPMRPTRTGLGHGAPRRKRNPSSATSPRTQRFARALCSRADVVARGLPARRRARLGVGPDDAPPRRGLLLDHRLRRPTVARGCAPVTTSTTSAGPARSRTPRHESPPLQIADLAAGALGAVTRDALAALLERERTGRRRRARRLDDASDRTTSSRTVSAASRCRRLLTGGLACYRIYATADDRSPHRRRARAEVLPPPLRAPRGVPTSPSTSTTRIRRGSAAGARGDLRDSRPRRLARALRRRGRLRVGPVLTRAGRPPPSSGRASVPAEVPLGAHTEAWRAELGMSG